MDLISNLGQIMTGDNHGASLNEIQEAGTSILSDGTLGGGSMEGGATGGGFSTRDSYGVQFNLALGSTGVVLCGVLFM